MEYLAHYDKKTGEKQSLKEHLNSVAQFASVHLSSTVEFDDICNEMIRKIIYWMGYLHDLGKYTDYFQEYLINDKENHLKNHAHISACYIYSFLSNIESNKKLNMDSQKILTFLCYLCIRLHHTSLKTEGLFPRGIWKDLYVLSEHLNKKSRNIFKDLCLEYKLTFEEFCSYFDIKTLENNKSYFEYIPTKFHSGRISDPKWYFLLIYLFSLLIDMDKLNSADIEPQSATNVPPDNVTAYLIRKHGKNFNSDFIGKREEVRKKMLEVINDLSDEEIRNVRFFTLSAPTGIGKTLSSLQCILRLQQRIQQIQGYTPRIITAIPFINIIEQNKLEYENVFGEDARLVVHHRFSDFSSTKSSKEEMPVDKALLETESWEGDAVLTTFVQLFQSIFTGENRLLKKINKIAGSIVVLDEAQAIPEDYMPLIGATLQLISKYYGTRFILMTATQPKLLEFGDLLFSMEKMKFNKNKRIELLPNSEKYFKNLDRTKFVPLLNKRLNNEEFIELFFEKWSKDKSALIVVNTIKRSIELYTKLKKELEQINSNVPIFYLSTNIIPLKRKQVIKEVRELLSKNQPVILVSTQTIEAGVDMDFDMAFRDFAPIDSLIQTAGRVNREGKKGKFLPVYIIQLENDNHYVYQLCHRQSTIELLTQKEEILEPEYGGLADKYYNLALERGVSDVSKRLWEEGIMKLKFDTLKEFKLIDNIGEVYDVFIEKKDSKATALADAYEEVLKYKDKFHYDLREILPESLAKQFGNTLSVFQRKTLLKLIRSRMSEYMVQIRVSRLKDNVPIEFKNRGNIDSNFYWVPPGQLENYYDEETGFKDESGNSFII